MFMTATVLRVDALSLLVRDMSTGQQVLVNTPLARNFNVGDQIRITFSGAMTPSIPPQIAAISIALINQPQQPQPPQPSQTEIRRARVLQVRRGSLLVSNPANRQQVIVNFAQAHHFCTNQLVNVRYDTIMLGNPAQVNATDVVPIC